MPHRYTRNYPNTLPVAQSLSPRLRRPVDGDSVRGRTSGMGTRRAPNGCFLCINALKTIVPSSPWPRCTNGLSSWRIEDVADPSHGLNVLRLLRIRLNLLPHPSNVDLEPIAVANVVMPPRP